MERLGQVKDRADTRDEHDLVGGSGDTSRRRSRPDGHVSGSVAARADRRRPPYTESVIRYAYAIIEG
ncbi:hypothetical protein O1Q96_04650 [Streptomyces sp. Qhu-G9]|uniref:hypothetical protein n=1 Tax=Streptomyces sp. Qhu-G9 TaxID=3452799 RepID=UPI0022AC2EBB|nr:hypothetical protein [Streptomyces aurantiacus]WAU79105.1 hypothetical protein O1Q96_04650 [Streptomyces aurantiacus]